MNIFQKFKEEKKYISLLMHHRNLQDEAKRREKESADNICDYFEQIVKTKAYKDKIIKDFNKDPYAPFHKMAEMSILIQALDKKDHKLGSDFRGEYEREYYYDEETFNFQNSELDEYIKTIFDDYLYDNSMSDLYYIAIDLAINPSKNIPRFNSQICITKDDLEYIDDDCYESVFYVDSNFERAIRALYNCYLENKEEIKQIMVKHIEEERVECYGY